jgi:hypothetical protein
VTPKTLARHSFNLATLPNLAKKGIPGMVAELMVQINLQPPFTPDYNSTNKPVDADNSFSLDVPGKNAVEDGADEG